MKKPMFSTMIVSAFFILISGCVPSAIVIDQTDTPAKTPIPAGFYTGTVTFKETITYVATGKVDQYTDEITYSIAFDQDGFPLFENKPLKTGSTLSSAAGDMSLTGTLTSATATDTSYSYTTQCTMIRHDPITGQQYTFTGPGSVYFKLLSDGTVEYQSTLGVLDSTGNISDEIKYTGILSK